MRILAENLRLMKRTIYILWLLCASILIGCKETKPAFTLKGNISDLPSDTLLAYFQLPEYRMDTLIANNGIFNYTFELDTLTIITLVLDSTNNYPIFAEKGKSVELMGTIDQLEIKGENDNRLLKETLQTLYNTPTDSVILKVDSIIKKNPRSFINLYLIDKYYVQDSAPDYEKLNGLISGMSGIIKDTPYMMSLQAKIESHINRDRNRNIYTLKNIKRNGEEFRWTSITDQYILLDFWSSWNHESIAQQDSLESVLKALKKDNFLVVSISLDLNKEDWLNAIAERDTTQWEQLCDFTGWNNILIKSQDIRQLPANILLNKHKQIIARDIRGQELIDKVKEQIKQDKEREKREEERKRRNQRRRV